MSEKFTKGSSQAEWRLALGADNPKVMGALKIVHTIPQATVKKGGRITVDPQKRDEAEVLYRPNYRSFNRLAIQLRESMDPYADARNLGLPIPSYQFFESVTTFLGHPEKLSEMGSDEFDGFYVSLRPYTTELPKYREIVPGDGIISYITNSVPPELRDTYNMRVAGHLPEICGGTIVVNPDGSIILEMVDGNQAKLARGDATPKYSGMTNEYGDMKYNFEDERMRRFAWNAISTIPFAEGSDPDSFRRERHPGYYEFAIGRRPDGSARLMFYDYTKMRPKSPFLTI